MSARSKFDETYAGYTALVALRGNLNNDEKETFFNDLKKFGDQLRKRYKGYGRLTKEEKLGITDYNVENAHSLNAASKFFKLDITTRDILNAIECIRSHESDESPVYLDMITRLVETVFDYHPTLPVFEKILEEVVEQKNDDGDDDDSDEEDGEIGNSESESESEESENEKIPVQKKRKVCSPSSRKKDNGGTEKGNADERTSDYNNVLKESCKKIRHRKIVDEGYTSNNYDSDDLGSPEFYDDEDSRLFEYERLRGTGKYQNFLSIQIGKHYRDDRCRYWQKKLAVHLFRQLRFQYDKRPGSTSVRRYQYPSYSSIMNYISNNLKKVQDLKSRKGYHFTGQLNN